jgi:hypothetical protein
MNTFRDTFFAMHSSRPKLNDVLIVRIDSELTKRVDHARLNTPALCPMSRSEFTRRAILCTLESVEPQTAKVTQ